MFTYEIRRLRTFVANAPKTTAPDTPVDREEKERRFTRHFLRFWANVGDYVAFKRPKKSRDLWKVVYVETDVDKMHWANDGWVPNYIKLERMVRQRDGTEQLVTLWTCESKLKSLGKQHG